jgi:hypothetical protein
MKKIMRYFSRGPVFTCERKGHGKKNRTRAQILLILSKKNLYYSLLNVYATANMSVKVKSGKCTVIPTSFYVKINFTVYYI